VSTADVAANRMVGDALLEPLSLAAASGSVARRQALDAIQGAMIASAASSLVSRRQLYASRFEWMGDFWTRKLRHCGWRQSLRMAFEVPALHAAEHAGQGYGISKPQFMAAVSYAVERNPAYVSLAEFDAFFAKCFEAFDVGRAGRVDYREFVCALLFFREPCEGDPLQLVNLFYRYYDGDVTGGVTRADLLRFICTLAVTGEEVQAVRALLNLGALEEARHAGVEFRAGRGTLMGVQQQRLQQQQADDPQPAPTVSGFGAAAWSGLAPAPGYQLNSAGSGGRAPGSTTARLTGSKVLETAVPSTIASGTVRRSAPNLYTLDHIHVMYREWR
jgi:hypothetical protein